MGPPEVGGLGRGRRRWISLTSPTGVLMDHRLAASPLHACLRLRISSRSGQSMRPGPPSRALAFANALDDTSRTYAVWALTKPNVAGWGQPVKACGRPTFWLLGGSAISVGTASRAAVRPRGTRSARTHSCCRAGIPCFDRRAVTAEVAHHVIDGLAATAEASHRVI